MRQRSSRKGTAATEFALILPILVTIALGCIDFGRFPYTQMTVNTAARAGAGVGSSTPYTAKTSSKWNSKVQQAIKDQMQNLPGYDVSKLSMTATYTVEASGHRVVSVDVSYPFQTAVSWPSIPQSVTLRHVVVMRSARYAYNP